MASRNSAHRATKTKGRKRGKKPTSEMSVHEPCKRATETDARPETMIFRKTETLPRRTPDGFTAHDAEPGGQDSEWKTDPVTGQRSRTMNVIVTRSEWPPPRQSGDSSEGKLPIDDIRTDGGTQVRVSMDEPTIERYREAIVAGADMPRLDVFRERVEPAEEGADPQQIDWLADGFHRLEAYRRAGKDRVPVYRHHGTRRDAVLFAVRANETHGLVRNNADRRRAVEMLLGDPEWGEWSARKVAEKCAVSHTFVNNIVTERQKAKADREAADEALRRLRLAPVGGASGNGFQIAEPSKPATTQPSTQAGEDDRVDDPPAEPQPERQPKRVVKATRKGTTYTVKVSAKKAKQERPPPPPVAVITTPSGPDKQKFRELFDKLKGRWEEEYDKEQIRRCLRDLADGIRLVGAADCRSAAPAVAADAEDSRVLVRDVIRDNYFDGDEAEMLRFFIACLDPIGWAPELRKKVVEQYKKTHKDRVHPHVPSAIRALRAIESDMA